MQAYGAGWAGVFRSVSLPADKLTVPARDQAPERSAAFGVLFTLIDGPLAARCVAPLVVAAAGCLFLASIQNPQSMGTVERRSTGKTLRTPEEYARRRSKKAGAICFLCKPYDHDELINCLDKALKAA